MQGMSNLSRLMRAVAYIHPAFILLLIHVCLRPTCGAMFGSQDGGGHSNQDGHHGDEHDIHGGIPMGIPDDGCDNGRWNIQLDFNPSSDVEYSCHDDPIPIPFHADWPVAECLDDDEIPAPLHKCLQESIRYTDIPPRGGAHRPLWPVYGEYVYAPPQRWVHSMEHGAAVFLYHPCAAPSEIDRLREVATSCLRRHILTPYRQLPRDQPFAVVTWGCRLMMENVNQQAIVDFVRTHALQTLETRVTEDGQYRFGLLQRAELVTDLADSDLCPGMDSNDIPLNAENMREWP